uniref:polysaccharide pyruvyl transferase family protein n=1 Tax=Brachyspira catarrhinii TaxID=2528966 RepID=UPI003F4BB26A
MNDNIKRCIDNIVWWIPFTSLRNSIRKYLLYISSMKQENIDLYNSIETKISELKKDFVRNNDLMSDIFLYNNEDKIFFIETPEHNNIGDNAIAYATNKMLKRIFPNKVIIEYTLYDFLYMKDILRKFIKNNDIIFFHGGGNLGNLWPLHEDVRRYVINEYLENKIVIMPQSIYFSEDDNGKKELEKSKKIYNLHKHLAIMVRDIKSYELANEYFYNNNIVLSPDIVLSLSNSIPINNTNRSGVIFLLREDKEKTINDSTIENIKFYLDSISENYVIENNMSNIHINNYKLEREAIVMNQLNKIQKYKLCITDRLHGAIFSYITNTPCIVFNSFYHKIEYGLKCLNDIDSITYIGESDNMEYIVHTIKKYLNNLYVNNKIDFELEIKKIILNILESI